MADLPPVSIPEIEHMSTEELRQEHARLSHAMQSGVAACLGIAVEARTYDLDPGPHDGECEPKHLRVGVNVALADAGSLARLLVAKGLITPLELYRSLVVGMRDEVASYERALTKHYRSKVTLG